MKWVIHPPKKAKKILVNFGAKIARKVPKKASHQTKWCEYEEKLALRDSAADLDNTALRVHWQTQCTKFRNSVAFDGIVNSISA